MFQAEDVFNAFFGGGGGDPRMARAGGGQHMPRETVVPVATTLEELYCGASKSLPLTRTARCGTCQGRGTKTSVPKAQTRCPVCRGAGMRAVVGQFGMMAQQMQMTCDACGGSGERIDPKNVCADCAGKKVVKEASVLTVDILPGMHDNERIVLRGKGNTDSKTLVSQNLVVMLQMEIHRDFTRNGNDLHVKRNITLAEALCGFQFKLQHLDGRELTVRRQRGEITRPGEMNMIKGEGMPLKGKGNSNGDLFVHLSITYPDSLTPEQLSVLQAALPQKRKSALANEPEENYDVCYATRTSVSTFRSEMEHEEADDDADDNESVHVGGCPVQ